MTTRPSLKYPDVILATWFGSGYLKPAPGTWGTLAALPFAAFIHLQYGPITLLVSALSLYFLGIWAAGKYSSRTNSHDASEIVIDEVVGIWVTLSMAPMTPEFMAIGFLLFRFFDIIKPFPINYLDRKISGGLGIMLDDLVAGFLAGACLLLILEIGIL